MTIARAHRAARVGNLSAQRHLRRKRDRATDRTLVAALRRCPASRPAARRRGRSTGRRPPGLAQAALVTLARPYMEDLYQFVEGSGFAVLLADGSLEVIEAIGDAPMLLELRARGLVRGASLREEQIGTLALNLALHEALPWQTRGAEHFCAMLPPAGLLGRADLRRGRPGYGRDRRAGAKRRRARPHARHGDRRDPGAASPAAQQHAAGRNKRSPGRA